MAGNNSQEKTRLEKENESLRQEIQTLVDKLNSLEGKKPTDPSAPVFLEKKPVINEVKKPPTTLTVQANTTVEDGSSDKGQPKEGKNKGKEGKKEGKSSAAAGGDRAVDISRLDFRVGKIITAQKHPDADGLYVEQVDLGEGKNRTVVSGLVRFVPLEEMEDRMALLLCNLKPAKMRGVVSEAMVMCASTPEKVEILLPPEGAVPGDRVVCEGFPGEPDAQLNPKKKIFEEVAPDLRTNHDGVFVYKGVPIIISGKGPFKAPSLKNVQVK